jgi:hypothetical protein
MKNKSYLGEMNTRNGSKPKPLFQDFTIVEKRVVSPGSSITFVDSA